MDKRFFLFLILAAIVLIVTPKLFPPARRAPGSTPASVDSLHRAPAETSTAAAPTVSAPSASAPAPTPAAPDTLASLPAATGDTVSFSTPKAVYRFSTIGAAPIAVTLPGYKALSTHDGNVELVRPGLPLLKYQILRGQAGGGGDTLHLDRVPFTVDSSQAGAGSAPMLTFRADVQGLRVAINYTFSPDSYVVRVRGDVEGQSAGGTGGSRFVLVTLPEGLNSQEVDSTDDQRHLAYIVKAVHDDPQSIAFHNLDTPEPHVESGPLRWIASKNKYFVVALLTDTSGTPFGGAVLKGLPRVGKAVTRATATVVQPFSSKGEFAFELYTGPQEWRRLVALGRDFENMNPYGGIFRGVIQPFATIVMRILLWMHDRLQINYGWLLIIFGVVVRVILWPLNQSAMRSSLRMQRIQPELQALQKKYKNNPEKQHTEMMRLYKEHGMSPFSPLAGCLPMLIPMPILYALYFVLANTIELRGVSFLWMADISLKDPLYILPILMGISMYVLSWIGLRNSPPNAQAKMMAYIFPVMMTVFFLNLAAGLNLYYAVQNIAALPQQWLIARERAKVASPPPVTQAG
jgi:YidC/Oxa1 family membrane protein insertase